MSEKGFPKKRLIAAAVLLVVTPAVWLLLDLPPPLYLARYGLPPYGEPTGQAVLIAGISFTELSPGYYRQTAPDLLLSYRYDPLKLFIPNRGAFTRRAQRDQSGNAGRQIMAQQPPVAVIIDSIVFHRRNNRQPDTAQAHREVPFPQ